MTAVLLFAVHLATGFEALPMLLLFASTFVLRSMQRRAAQTAPFPPYPDPPPRLHLFAWERWGWLPGSAALGAVAGGIGYLLGGPIALWLLVALAPLLFVTNRYGVERRPKHLRWSWRRLVPGRSGAEPSP